MELCEWLKYTDLLHEIEQVVKNTCTSNKEVVPKSFYALVVDTLPGDYTPMVWAMQWMRQHVIAIFYTTITSHSGR